MPCRAGIQAPQGRRNPGPPTTSGAAAGTQAPGHPSARGAVAAKAAGRRRGSAPRRGPLRRRRDHGRPWAPAAAARPQADHPRRRRRGTATGRPPEAAATRRGHGPTTLGSGGGAAKGPRPGDGAATAPRLAADSAMEGPDPSRRKPGPAPAAGGGEVGEVRAAG